MINGWSFVRTRIDRLSDSLDLVLDSVALLHQLELLGRFSRFGIGKVHPGRIFKQVQRAGGLARRPGFDGECSE